MPTEATLELTDDGINLTELTIPANFDFTLKLSNLTDSDAQFRSEALGIDQTMPAGEVQTITINAGEGEYDFEVDGQTGTITALPQAEE